MKKLTLTLIAIVVTTFSLVAQTKFELVPPRNVIAGNRFSVVYRLTGGQGTDLRIPRIDGCNFLYNSQSSSYSMSVGSGGTQSSYTIEYTYTYRAEQEGTYTVPSASVVVDGKTYTTQKATFKVLPPDASSQVQQGRQQGGQQSARVDDRASQDRATQIGKDDIFVRVILNKAHAYEGEAIECTLKLYTKFERINSFTAKTPPSFDGFLIEELNTQAQLNDFEHYNGQNYLTAVLKRCIIYPQKAGKLSISSGSYDLSVIQIEQEPGFFFPRVRQVEKSVSLRPFTQTVEISALPQPQPASFSGAVGRFQIDSSLSSETPRTGEAVSLKYVVTGTGNIKFIQAPKPVIPSEFEQYTPRTESNARVTGSTMTGTTTIDYTLVPQSVGRFTIKPLEWTYFDLDTKSYVTLTTKGYNMEVAKGSGATQGSSPDDITLKNTDILHIKLGDKHLSQTHKPVINTFWYWLIYIGLVVALIVTLAAYRRQLKLNADEGRRRTSRASKVARRHLKTAARFMQQHDSQQFYEALLKAMWGYLGDKLQIPASQLSRQAIVETLASRGVDETLSARIIDILDRCEMARYTPDASDASSIEALYNEASDAINAMEKAKLTR